MISQLPVAFVGVRWLGLVHVVSFPLCPVSAKIIESHFAIHQKQLHRSFQKREDPSNHPILECICPGCRNFQVPKANRLSESKRRRTYAGGPDGYRPVGTAMEGYRGGIGAVSPPVTWQSWFRMPVLFQEFFSDKDNVHII